MYRAIIVCSLIVILSPLLLAGDNLPEQYISFNFDEISVEEAFKSISLATNVNIVVNASLDTKLSMVLNRVKLSTAVDMITGTCNLDYVFSDGILYIDTAERIKEFFPGVKGKHDHLELAAYSPSNMIISANPNGKSNLVVNIGGGEEEIIEPGFRELAGINRGTLIPCKLEVGLISSSEKTPALVRVTKDISYQGKIVIPKGSIFTGYGLSDYGVRQIFVNLDKLIIGDREIDVKAHMVKGDGTPGFCSEYRDLKMEKFWPTFLLNFVGSIGTAFKDVVYIKDDSGLVQSVEAPGLKNELIDKTQQGIGGWSDELMNDAERFQAIMIVHAGYKGFVFINEKIGLDKFE